MKTLILAAGYGTRLYPLTKDRPKPLLKIGSRTIIDHLLEKVKGITDLTEVIVITNEKFFGHFKKWAEAKTAYPKMISVVNDETQSNDDRLGSVGDMHFALQNKNIKEDLLVLGGDNLFDFDLGPMVTFAQNSAPSVTVGLYDIKNSHEARKYGVVEIDSEQKIIDFQEKPKNPKSTLIATCLYYFPVASLHFISGYMAQTKSSDTSGEYIQWLAKQSDVLSYTAKGRWYDIGSIEAYEDAQNDFKS